MNIFDKAKSYIQKSKFKTVRIEPVQPLNGDREIDTDTVWFEDENIDKCIAATFELKIKHIHLQTSHIEFLKDPRLQHVKGIVIQYEVDNIELLYQFKELTHLGLPENIRIVFDFSNFPKLIYLGGSFPKKYINFNKLTNLKYTYLFDYRKKDLSDFSSCSNIQKLWIYSLNIENLNGLSGLSELIQIDLENCRKLISLDGIDSSNSKLQKLHLVNCKSLKNADSLKSLPNLIQLQLYNVLELDSLNFLYELPKLETLMLHPSKVGVKQNDYYPLIDTLVKINKLEILKGWKPLKSYLNKTFMIQEPIKNDTKSELELIKANLGILDWVGKVEAGLEQYSKNNCKKLEAIISNMISQLELIGSGNVTDKEEIIKNGVLEINCLNNSLNGCFIETGEREELCDIFDNIAEAAGLDLQAYEDGIASKWREW